MAINKKIDGKTVKSDFEYETYNQILEVLPVGATVAYEADRLPYVVEHVYIPDFTITLPSGKKIYIEAKGNGRIFDHHARQKMVAVKEQHPDKDVFISFYKDGRITGSKKRKKGGGYYTQSQWATKNGYIYAIREIIKDWFK